MERCRFRDPTQAENPALQDSIVTQFTRERRFMSKRSCEAAESIEDASFANGAGERTANAQGSARIALRRNGGMSLSRPDAARTNGADDRSPAQNPTEMLTIRYCPKNTLML